MSWCTRPVCWITLRQRGRYIGRGVGEVIGVKRVLAWAAVVFVIYYLVTAPDGAAHLFDVAVGWLKGAGHSLGTFLDNLKL